jgi:hypothetical protein
MHEALTGSTREGGYRVLTRVLCQWQTIKCACEAVEGVLKKLHGSLQEFIVLQGGVREGSDIRFSAPQPPSTSIANLRCLSAPPCLAPQCTKASSTHAALPRTQMASLAVSVGAAKDVSTPSSAKMPDSEHRMMRMDERVYNSKSMWVWVRSTAGGG